jgi:(1->4)-alpha-D-glucan 1-alpha-D-glucosylmutase
MTLRATYRLQFHKEFTFADAARHAPYFADLGISHIYASPILTARAGSHHGYDVVDHSRINAELGGEEGFRAMVRALRARGLGLIIDIVPNHMAVGKADNAWWLDLLAHGPGSRYARAFDIDWDAPGLEGKVLAPFLGDQPAAALQKGELKLVRENGQLAFAYFDHRFPLRAEDQLLRDRSFSVPELQDLMARQHYVLAHWHEANPKINWRRFFDITDLAAIRVAEPEIFEAVHEKIFALYAEGLIDGVRVDHVDGLADPRGYCRTLRARLEGLRPGAILFVEKILAGDETLPPDWEVDGTTGYDFLEQASAILHRDDGGALTELWRKVSNRAADFEPEEIAARREMLSGPFESQSAAVARAFAPLLNLSQAQTKTLLGEVLVRLRCYRSYATGRADTPGPGRFLREALSRTSADRPDLSADIARLEALFERKDDDPAVVDSLRRFAQLSAPLAAKSVEDTAFYRFGRLLSRNDVGTDPRRHFMPVEEFHGRMLQRAAESPRAMLSTATHDHKRGEDARARLSVLSCHPELWQAFVAAAPQARGLDSADHYQLLQTLFAAWPSRPDNVFAERIQGWCEKFLREGKLRSSWSQPDQDYEARFCGHATDLIVGGSHGDFRARLTDLLTHLAPDIKRAVVSQLVLRNTVPGIADLYQGGEFEDLSLVDPDNRRPVDFEIRKKALDDPEIEKLQLLRRLLAARRQDPDLWAKGDYQPIMAPDCLAFQRAFAGRSLSVFLRREQGFAGDDLTIGREGKDILTGRNFGAGPVQQSAAFAIYPALVLYQA